MSPILPGHLRDASTSSNLQLISCTLSPSSEDAMTDQSFTTTFSIDRSPQEVYDAINDVRAWWSAEVEGPTDVEGETFTFRVKDLPRSQIRVAELVPGERVVWTVLENYMSFVEDQTEWVNTQIRFDLT